MRTLLFSMRTHSRTLQTAGKSTRSICEDRKSTALRLEPNGKRARSGDSHKKARGTRHSLCASCAFLWLIFLLANEIRSIINAATRLKLRQSQFEAFSNESDLRLSHEAAFAPTGRMMIVRTANKASPTFRPTIGYSCSGEMVEVGGFAL